MLTKVHQRLGTAGFVIAIVALVAALSGGAYAASGGLTGKQKKEVEKIAKQYAGKPGKNGAPGATGAAGATGGAGSKGDTGAQGEKGLQGEKGDPGAAGSAGAKGDTGNTGAAGASPTAVKLTPTDPGECEGSGGAKIIPVNPSEEDVFVCNGSGGSGGGFPATLPSGSTETGMWTVSAASPTLGPALVSTVSFNVPLASASVGAFFIEPGGTATPEEIEKCPGTVAAPTAEPGYLCVYPKVGGLTFLAGEPLTVGAGLFFAPGTEGFGTWAVTAE